ncbi:MAG TPA: peptidase U32 family protein [Termitinemataceae bacterium]|nr:peptidase U32 family protein [Termitinemataceae bacterium]HOM22739.1 peptidase U32 family protein [Termitinemataceae bacterium]HPQ00856.1 peptidase U32 family protein [Termitinemataceae bacterium]
MGRHLELLSPAGSFETLETAIQAGADSIYFGIGSYDMRSLSSKGFTRADLEEIRARSAHKKVRAYCTLNAVVFDEELEDIESLVADLARLQFDGIIAHDMAVLQIARRYGVPVHLSTQANITNREALRFYSSFAEVIVLARELSLPQIRRIAQFIQEENLQGPSQRPLRLEAFVHGALCMAYSGKCYLSLHMMGSSANRGACLHSCRRSYRLIDTVNGNEIEVAEGYLLSSRDLKTIDILDQLVAAGIEVFKIEGRSRSPEYVATTTACYREALDAIEDGTFTADKIKIWNERLGRVFNRGFWEGHYLGKTMGEWSDSYGSKASRKKVHIGKVVNYFDRAGVAEILLQAGDLSMGEELLIIGKTTGLIELVAQELRVEDEVVRRAPKGTRCTLPCPVKIREGDIVYRWEKTEESFLTRPSKEKLPTENPA